MKQIICVLLLISCCTFCTQLKHKENSIYVNFDRPEKASLSDYFHTVELIPFETDTNVFMKYISHITYDQNKYYILDQNQSIVFVFDKQGNFIYKIDNKGQGPGEYVFIQYIHINPFSNRLELLSPMGFVYDYDLLTGNYIETNRIVYDGFNAVHHSIALDSITHVFLTKYQSKKIIYFNISEEKLLHEEFEEESNIGSYSRYNFYPYNDNWFFFRPFHTVIYKIEKKQLTPAFHFDFGKYTKEGLTANFPQEPPRGVQEVRNRAFTLFPYWIQNVGHNDNYVLAQLLWQKDENYVNIIYDKSTNVSKYIPEFEEKTLFSPHIVTDDYVLSWCLWNELEQYIPPNLLDNSSKIRYECLLKSEIETNPILIKYYFKK